VVGYIIEARSYAGLELHLVRSRLNIINHLRQHLTKDELTLGQKIHLRRVDIKQFLTFQYVFGAIGVILIILTLVALIPAVQDLESFGDYEYRFATSYGPVCNPDDWLVGGENTWPAQILEPSGGANEAGLQFGDIIIRINDVEINNVYDLDVWPDLLPDVKPGDYVDVVVLRDMPSLSQSQLLMFNVKTTGEEDAYGINPRIGVFTVIYEVGTGVSPCYLQFIQNQDDEFASDNLAKAIDDLYLVGIVGIGFGILLVLIMIMIRPHISKLSKDLDEWEKQFIDEDYVVTFSTKKPQGKTNGEKIFSLAQDVFPELRTGGKDGKTSRKWGGVVKNSNDYKFDVFEKFGDYDVFVSKHFGDKPVTKEMLQEACDEVEKCTDDKKVKEKIGGTLYIKRLVFVVKSFDFGLESDSGKQIPWEDLETEEMDKLVGEMMDSIDYDVDVDLMLETENGYSILYLKS